MRRYYSHNRLAGCVQQRRCRVTGTRVGVYHGEQSGIDTDTGCPWVTVCEEHGTMVTNTSLALARASASDPRQWCEECRHMPREAWCDGWRQWCTMGTRPAARGPEQEGWDAAAAANEHGGMRPRTYEAEGEYDRSHTEEL